MHSISDSKQSLSPLKTKGRHKKVKSGCRTCKIRRVKCDEGRPACQRCLSSKRVCDGYGIWGGGGNGYGERYGSQATHRLAAQNNTPIPAPIDPRTVKLSPREAECFEWFTSRSIAKLPGIFGSAFWDILVLPASSSEPAILHAALALSSAHRGENARLKPCIMDDTGQFTLRQYSKAIHHLRPHLQPNSKGSATIPLVVCLLFTYLEYLCGRYNAAATHLQSGLKLLREMHADEGTLYSGGVVVLRSLTTPIEQCIVECFARLHVQGVFFGQRELHLGLLLQPAEDEVSIPVFETVGQARDTLDKTLHALLQVDELSREPDNNNDIIRRLGQVEELAQERLSEWHETYKRTMVRFRDVLSVQDFVAYKLILVYHTMANIMAHCLESKQETRYDSQTPAFASIIKQSIDIWNNRHFIHHFSESTTSNSIADIGWITPLYYTALKCRNHRIRLQAIKLLSTTSHKEGVWDAKLVVRILRQVVELEEQGYYRDTPNDFAVDSLPAAWELDLPVLPESYRFHDVQVDVSDDNTGAVVVTYKRRMFNEESEVQVHHLSADFCL